MPRLDVKGEICSNSNKEIYDWWGIEATCPKDVMDAIEATMPGETLDIYINSPGGEIFNGSEIYSAIREASQTKDIKMHIVGLAASAASVIAMAGNCDMSPTAMMMVHCVSTGAWGNHSDLEKTAEVLRSADEALCSAYTEKSGMTKEEALNMMEKETWLSAQKALELGLIDSLMFSDNEPSIFTNSFSGMSLTQEQIEKARAALEQQANPPAEPDNRSARYKYNKRKLELAARKPI